jgi:acyl-CoA oxidase
MTRIAQNPVEQQAVDIADARAQCSFPVDELTYLFHGGKAKWERKQQLMKLVEEDPVFDRSDRYFLGRTEASCSNTIAYTFEIGHLIDGI